MINLVEIREYNFEGGVRLLVRLDRKEKTASFVEYDKAAQDYVPCRFMFSGRGLSYMNGWNHILSCMQHVIKDIKPVMEQWDQEETDRLIHLLTSYLSETPDEETK